MSSSKTNPATLAACGARKTDLLAGSIISDITPPPLTLQVSRLLARFGWSDARARAVAEHAFSNGKASA